LTSIVVVLLLALTPATSFADGGAGDQQYQDPLTAPAPKKPKKAQTTAPSSTSPAATTAPVTTSAPASTTASQQTAPAQQLPRTGAPAGLIGLAGGVLIASGAALRRRTASQ
jgi:LPXTG-motif cell wall-anchored protein